MSKGARVKDDVFERVSAIDVGTCGMYGGIVIVLVEIGVMSRGVGFCESLWHRRKLVV